MAAPLAIHLLGPDPRVLHGGATSPAPRGRKTWALLAYLVAADAAPSRELLAELLFANAEDPMNALSWNLSQLRRLLGPEVEVGGSAIVLRLPDDAYVDVRSLSTATWRQGLAIPDLGRDLLDGMTFPGCPIFETWLLATRRRLHGSADAVLMEAAQALLSEGRPARALPLASRLVSANPLDENAHELLIRAYAAAGDLDAAQTQLHRSVTLLRRELGIDPASSLLEAATAPAPRFAVAAVRATPQTLRARLEAGTAAQDAGAADTAIDLFRQAVVEAHGLEDDRLLVRALVALGSALVHGVRGRDGEGAAYLHEAIGVADNMDDPGAAAQAHRELGYVELLRGRYDRAQRWLATAVDLADEDSVEQAWALAMQGIASTDTGRYDDAETQFHESLRIAERDGVEQVTAWSSSFLGRLHLLRDDLALARQHLTTGLETAGALRWTAFTPLPETLLADVDIREGRLDDAAAAYEHALALALQFDDPCWEGLAARGLGLVAAHDGRPRDAYDWLDRARTRCVRLPDAYLWVEGYCLDALCDLAIEHHFLDARRAVADLEALATRTGMRHLVARAVGHRARLGDRAAADSQRTFIAELST